MKLGATEKLIKSYDYFKGSHKHSGTLILTDRRVVRVMRDQYGEHHSEIRIDDISSIESGYDRYRFSPAGIVCMVIGAILAAAGAVLASLFASEAYGVFMWGITAVGAVFALLGLLIFLSVQKTLFLLFSTDVRDNGHGLDVHVSNYSRDLKNHREKKARKEKKLRIKIKDAAALDMINEISALIWELQYAGEAGEAVDLEKAAAPAAEAQVEEIAAEEAPAEETPAEENPEA